MLFKHANTVVQCLGIRYVITSYLSIKMTLVNMLYRMLLLFPCPKMSVVLKYIYTCLEFLSKFLTSVPQICDHYSTDLTIDTVLT